MAEEPKNDIFRLMSEGVVSRPVVPSTLPDPAPMTVIRALPVAKRPPAGGEEIMNALIGATIVDIGAPEDDAGLEGGGFVIDYIPAGSSEIHRVVFSQNQCGMAVAWHGSLTGVTSNASIFDH